MKKRFGRKGLSPVIATVLLLAMVVVIGLIVFMWFRGLTQESVTKFGGENVELVCDRVSFKASYSGGNLFISNGGNVPIFGMKVKISGAGSHETKDIKELSENWVDEGLNQGGAFSDEITFSGSEITLIPVLLGNSKEGIKKTHVCDENLYGNNIIL